MGGGRNWKQEDCSFTKHFLSVKSMPGTMASAKDTKWSATDRTLKDPQQKERHEPVLTVLYTYVTTGRQRMICKERCA